MVTSFVLFAVETVPLLVYIFVGVVILSVPAFAIWDKVIQPKLDAKKKAAKEFDEPIEPAEPALADIGALAGEAAPAEEIEGFAMPAEGEGELAMPGDEDVAAGDEDQEVAFGEALEDDDFSIDVGKKT